MKHSPEQSLASGPGSSTSKPSIYASQQTPKRPTPSGIQRSIRGFLSPLNAQKESGHSPGLVGSLLRSVNHPVRGPSSKLPSTRTSPAQESQGSPSQQKRKPAEHGDTACSAKKRLTKKSQSAYEEQLGVLKMEREAALARTEHLQGALEAEQQRAEKLEKQLQDRHGLEAELAHLHQEVAELRTQLAAGEAEVVALREQLAQAEEAYQVAVDAEVSSLKQQLLEAQQAQATVGEAEVASLKQQLATAQQAQHVAEHRERLVSETAQEDRIQVLKLQQEVERVETRQRLVQDKLQRKVEQEQRQAAHLQRLLAQERERNALLAGQIQHEGEQPASSKGKGATPAAAAPKGKGRAAQSRRGSGAGGKAAAAGFAVRGQSMQRDRQEQGADCNCSDEESPAAARIRQAFAELGQVKGGDRDEASVRVMALLGDQGVQVSLEEVVAVRQQLDSKAQLVEKAGQWYYCYGPAGSAAK